ncbi:MAG: S-layer protein [Candidatus Aenigmarchaeota archaeon]|nr:S-layer protein [Candidatus Aenigmarchaeota archaeon]
MNIVLGKTGAGQYNNSVLINYVNKTATWSATAIPEFRLFSTSTAEAKDVQAYSTDVSGIEQKVDVGVASQNVVTDAGDVIVTPNAYSGSDIVKVKVPAQVLFAKLYIGSLTSGTAGSTASYTSYPSIPVVSAVAKLDTEIKADATLRAKNLIVVGGPCVNQVAADALGVTYPACGASSTVPQGAALIKVVDSPYTEGTGKSVLVVAGWEADNTRAATSVMQQFDTKLAGVTASSVTVSGTVGAPTVTPS